MARNFEVRATFGFTFGFALIPLSHLKTHLFTSVSAGRYILLNCIFENFLISTFQLLDRAITARSNNWKVDIGKFSQ